MATDRPWFNHSDFKKIVLTKFKSISDRTIVQQCIIEDERVIQYLMKSIQAIPANGDMMISFGPDVPYLNLSFEGLDYSEPIHFYRDKIKTPSTGFNSEQSTAEMNVYLDLENVLHPDLNKKILRIENLPIQFSDFSISYLGSTFEDHAPLSISFHKDVFLITCKNGLEERITITSGQLPPQPEEFKTEEKTYMLCTYKNSKNESVYPMYFMVEDKE
jgi:hypothetical protein